MSGSAAPSTTPRAFRSAAVWTPSGLRHDLTVVVDARGVITAVRPGHDGDGPARPGLLLPGLLNAHTHLEHATFPRPVPGGEGFVAWARDLMPQLSEEAHGGRARSAAGRAAARELVASGTAWVSDVSGSGDTASWLWDAGLRGVVHHELLGFDKHQVPEQRNLALAYARFPDPVDGVYTRPSPHALFSTAPALVRAAVAAVPGVFATLHAGESADEEVFLTEGTGPHAELLDSLGRDWRWWRPYGGHAVDALEQLGLLGPQVLVVHGIWLSAAALRRMAAASAPLCLCPRSNVHIEGRLPDVVTAVEAGVPLCIGTDGPASTPDLDVLRELPVLAAAFPEVDPEVWLTAVTHGAARALGQQGVGVLEPGARPGLLWLEGVEGPADLAGAAPDPSRRHWLVPPGDETPARPTDRLPGGDRAAPAAAGAPRPDAAAPAGTPPGGDHDAA